jgi:hypothetical protein
MWNIDFNEGMDLGKALGTFTSVAFKGVYFGWDFELRSWVGRYMDLTWTLGRFVLI